MRQSPAPEVRFHQPPVRATRLTVHFETGPRLEFAHLYDLVGIWRKDYPLIDQGMPDPRSLPRLSDSESLHWPLPELRFGASNQTRSLSLQDGSFEVAWRFDSEGSYPGYAALSAEMEHRFDQFVSAVDQFGVVPELKSCRCDYENVLAGLSAEALAVGMLTDWKGEPSSTLPDMGEVSLRIHACATTENHDCTSYIYVDPDDSGDDATMTISVSHDYVEGTEPLLIGLDEAHRELIDLFLAYTSDSQQKAWGRYESGSDA